MAAEPAVGTKIKRARERRRWTQKQLADEVGVSQKTIDNWENGRTSPKSSIGALEEVLGVRLDGEPDPELPTPEEMQELREHIREVMRDKAGVVVDAMDQALAPGPRPRRSAAGEGDRSERRPAS